MTTRDRIVLMGISVLVVLAAIWLLAVSPQRKQAAKLSAQVSAARSQLASAESKVASARAAQSRYSAAYASIVSLGKAVPSGQEMPSLIYELDQASNHKQVDFSSIVAGSGTGSSAPSSGGAGGSSTPGAAMTGFTQMPFTFVFSGSYPALYNLFAQLNRFTMRTASGALRVNGRLLTIQGVKLAPASGSAAGSGKGAAEQLTATISATAYVLPSFIGLTNGPNAASLAGGATQPAATTGASSSPTAPAIARVTP
jgi:hypothetical protein